MVAMFGLSPLLFWLLVLALLFFVARKAGWIGR